MMLKKRLKMISIMDNCKLAMDVPFVQRRGDWLTKVALDENIKAPVVHTAVILAHLYWNQKKHSMWAGLKEVAIMTNVHKKTVARHLVELSKQGYIETHQKGCGRNAIRYFTVNFKRNWKIDKTENLRQQKLQFSHNHSACCDSDDSIFF